MLKTSGKRTEPQSTVPGVRGVKKGVKVVAKKAVVKKAVVKKQSKKK